MASSRGRGWPCTGKTASNRSGAGRSTRPPRPTTNAPAAGRAGPRRPEPCPWWSEGRATLAGDDQVGAPAITVAHPSAPANRKADHHVAPQASSAPPMPPAAPAPEAATGRPPRPVVAHRLSCDSRCSTCLVGRALLRPEDPGRTDGGRGAGWPRRTGTATRKGGQRRADPWLPQRVARTRADDRTSTPKAPAASPVPPWVQAVPPSPSSTRPAEASAWASWTPTPWTDARGGRGWSIRCDDGEVHGSRSLDHRGAVRPRRRTGAIAGRPSASTVSTSIHEAPRRQGLQGPFAAVGHRHHAHRA